MRKDLERMLEEHENPFRRRRFYNDWWIVEWLPYLLIACALIGGWFLLSWIGDMREQDCRDKGGDHRVRTGKYRSLCVTKDGRIVE